MLVTVVFLASPSPPSARPSLLTQPYPKQNPKQNRYYHHPQAMSDCMAQHYSEEIFAKFLADRGLPPVQQRASLTERLASSVFGGK